MIEQTDSGVKIFVKVVPSASANEIVGKFGGRVKIRITAPPEGGKANKAICTLLASELQLAKHNVSVVAGMSNPNKTVSALGVSVGTAMHRLGL